MLILEIAAGIWIANVTLWVCTEVLVLTGVLQRR